MLNNSRDQDQTKVLEQFKADSNYLENHIYINISRIFNVNPALSQKNKMLSIMEAVVH